MKTIKHGTYLKENKENGTRRYRNQIVLHPLFTSLDASLVVNYF